MTNTYLSSDHEMNSCSSKENSSSHESDSESDISDTSIDSLDSDFHPECTENFGDSDNEPEGQDDTIAASKPEKKKQFQRDPIQGDNMCQHAFNIRRLIRQAESHGKHCYLGPAVGWDEETLYQFLRSIDLEIPDAANMTGKSSVPA
jgi:hypothetical protein